MNANANATVEIVNADGTPFLLTVEAQRGRELTVTVSARIRGRMLPVAEYYLETLLSRPRHTGLLVIDGQEPLVIEEGAMEVAVDFLARQSEFMLAAKH